MIPPAPHRVGQPSPLVFHLGAALSAYGQALFAAPRADTSDFPWSEDLAAAAAALGPDLDRTEIAAELGARLAATLRGLEAWQTHPWRRPLADPPEIWRAGGARLLDYGAAPEATDPDGPPVLVIPSLINRAYILDLTAERSMLRRLAGRGLRPVLLDWGAPGRAETGFDLDAYGARRLLPALRHLQTMTGRPVSVLGYCMGGTLAAGLAAREPNGVASLSTIGAPWDFASTDGIAGGFRALIRAQGPHRVETLLDSMGQAFGAVPVSLFQTLFALVNPLQAALKFRRFSALDPDSPAARHFVALEDWLADGVPMAAPAARDLLVDWQIRNVTASGRWAFLGGPVDPSAIRVPSLVFCGRGDSIAPAPLARPLGALIPDATLIEPVTGHVGMIVGSAAPAQVWDPLAAFLAAHAG